MSQIIKAFMGVFLTLFMALTAMGILAAYMEVMNAQDMQARIVDEIENSDFNTGVVQQCFLQSEEAGYQLKVTFFNENSTVATVSQVSQIPYGMDGVNMAKVEMQFPFQVAFLWTHQPLVPCEAEHINIHVFYIYRKHTGCLRCVNYK